MNLHLIPAFSRPTRAGQRVALVAMAACLLFTFIPSGSGQALPPDLLSYQGYLADENGNPLAPATPENYRIVFGIYTEATGGQPHWVEEQVVTVDRGNFSVVLGEGAAVGNNPHPPLSSVLHTNNAAIRHVGITVNIAGTDYEILPRLRLLPTAYAFLATSAHHLNDPSGNRVLTYINNGIDITGNLDVSGTLTGNGSGLTGLNAGQIPFLPASRVNSGVFDAARIPSLDASRINSGIFASARIPNLDASKINTGVLAVGRIPDIDAAKVTSGTLNVSRLPSQAARRDAANTFAGTQVVNGNLGVGTASPQARLDVNGDIKISGVRPFHFQKLTFSSGETAYDTGWDTNRYVVSIAGFTAGGGDINESGGVGTLIQVRAIEGHPAAPLFNSPNWWVTANFRTHNSDETWTVIVMRVVRELVTDNSTF